MEGQSSVSARDAWTQLIAERTARQEAKKAQAREWNGDKINAGDREKRLLAPPAPAPIIDAGAGHRKALTAPPPGSPASPIAETDTFVRLCESSGLPVPVRELRFDKTRRFRFDYAWPEQRLAVEIDGGAWSQGRHTRGKGFIEDQRKRNLALLLGWRVLHYTPDRLDEAVRDLRVLLTGDAA
jgi:hypothetical protein